MCDVTIAVAGDGEETKIDAHSHDQHDPQPEARDRLTEKSKGHANHIKEAVPLDGREDANRDGKDKSPKQRKEDESTRCRYPLENETERGLFIPDGFPEIALEGSFQKEKILDWDGPIQAEFFPDGGTVCLRGVRANHDTHWISCEARDDKDGNGNANDDDNRMKESPGQVAGHRSKKRGRLCFNPPLSPFQLFLSQSGSVEIDILVGTRFPNESLVDTVDVSLVKEISKWRIIIHQAKEPAQVIFMLF
jgi:hypothetical protein